MATKLTPDITQSAITQYLQGMQTGAGKAVQDYSEAEAKKAYENYKYVLEQQKATMGREQALAAGYKPYSYKVGDETMRIPESANQFSEDDPRFKAQQTAESRKKQAEDRRDAQWNYRLAQDKKKELMASNKYDDTAKKGTFETALKLYHALDKDAQSLQGDTQLTRIEQRRDALEEVVKAAREAGIDVGEYEIYIPDDDRNWFDKLIGKSAPVGEVVPAGNVLVISPDGTEGYIPRSQLSEALGTGYKQVGQ